MLIANRSSMYSATIGVASVSVLALGAMIFNAQAQSVNRGGKSGTPANVLVGPVLPIIDGAPAPILVDEVLVGELGMRTLPGGKIATNTLPNLLPMNGQGAGAFDSARHYVIQLDGPMTPQRRESLEQLGLAMSDYLPANAWVTRLPADQPNVLANLAATGFVIWVGEYQNSWKLDPELGQRIHYTVERQQLAAQGSIMLEVTLFEGEDPQAAINQIQALVAQQQDGQGPGAVQFHGVENIADNQTISLTIPLAKVAQLAAISGVQYVQESGEFTPRNDTTRWIVQTNVNNGLFPLYSAGIRGDNQIIGHIDGAINISHCSFRDTANPVGPSHRKIVLNSGAGYDSHGTHTAGTAAGDNFSDAGNTRGVAYMAKIAHTTGFSAGPITTHHNVGARIHTNSWGNDGTTSYDSVCASLDSFSYSNQDSLVMFAVTNTSTLKNPENAKNILAVGASGDTPSQANFCSGGTGPTNDQRRKPEIFAPGCNSSSATGSTTTACGVTGMTGTSMACPAVAGAGALVREYYTAGYYPTGAEVSGNAFTPTGALIKATLINGGVDMTGISQYPSNLEGWGRLLLDEALYVSGEQRKLVVYDIRNNAAGALSTGNVVDRTVNVATSGQKLKVTLVWTDPAATSGANPAYINNLDLEVITPGGGSTYLGNFFSGGVSVAGGAADFRNNVEQVHIINPPTGAWTVRVKGTAVNQGIQGYALVISGDVTTGPPAPANDICSNAAAKAPGTHAFTTLNATTDGPDEPGACTANGYSHIDNDVWFITGATCTGTMTISVCDADFDTKIAVYGSACPSGSGQYVACNDDSCGTGSSVTFPVTNGQLFRVRVGGFQGATGSGNIVIACNVPPPACPADTNGDSLVNVADLLAVIQAWGACPGCAADINDDNVVNVSDLLAVIQAWGSCP